MQEQKQAHEDDTAKPAEASLFCRPLDVTARDEVTGFSGRIIGRAEWTTGCRTYCLAPQVGKDGAYQESQWFDEARVLLDGESACMPEGPTASIDRPVGGPIPRGMPRK